MTAKNIITNQPVTKEKLQRAKELRREMTPAEKILWEELRANKLGVRFRRQQVIQGFIVDFYCHKSALVVEVDGDSPLRPLPIGRGTSPKYDIETLDNYQDFSLSYLGEAGWGSE